LIIRSILLLSFIPVTAFSAFEETDWSARAGGMGSAFTGLSDEGSAIFYNPAGLSKLRSGEFTFFANQLYGLKEFTNLVFLFGQPLSYGSLGIGFSQFGHSGYKEQIGVLAYSRGWKNFHIGGTIKGMNLSITDYGSDQTLGIDIGILWNLRENLTFGATGKNINNPEIGQAEELSRSVLFGASLRPGKKLLIDADFIKEHDFDLQVRLGQEYLLSDNFALRAGWITTPHNLTGGFGYRLKGIHLDYGTRSHPDLGFTHSISLSYKLNQD
jgi:hypothetical protein